MRGIMSLRFPVLVLLLSLLSGCGFALRGTANLPEALQTLQLASVDANSDLQRELNRALRNAGVEIVDTASAYRLGLGLETITERTLSVNSNARAGEYELDLGVQFQLSQGGSMVLGPEALHVKRVYLTDPENAVAKSEEAELIRAEMRRELAQQILRRLQTVAP